MDDIGHVDAAIAEVTKARTAVLRRTNRQVRSNEEREMLKAVSFAWFKSHRPHVRHSEAAAVDAHYKVVLDSTAMNAARSTYANALRDAKITLGRLRTALATARLPGDTAVSDHDQAPSFSPLTADAGMQIILEGRWDEVQRCIRAEAYLAATVMMGGLLESLLLARINAAANKGSIYKAAAAPRDRTGKVLGLSEWKLVSMVAVAHELGWISKSAKDVGNVLREFRNYVHPHKEHAEGVRLKSDDALMFWEVCKVISKQILESVASR